MSEEHDQWLMGIGVSEDSFQSSSTETQTQSSETAAAGDAGGDSGQTSEGNQTSQGGGQSNADGGTDGGSDAGTAMFELAAGGIGVMPDPADNPDGHNVPHHESGTRISFEVRNVGTAGGNARVGVELDDNFVTEWQSPYLDPGQSAVGYVSLGRLSQDSHTVLIYVNPGSGQNDHQTNQFNVE
jgi:hypothetical protein